jgi:hypothetical protein
VRMETIGEDATHSCFEVLWIQVPSLEDPAVYTANTTILLTPKTIRRAFLPLFGGRRTVEYLRSPSYGGVQLTHLCWS